MILVEYYSERDFMYNLIRKKMYIDITKIQYITLAPFDLSGTCDLITIGINNERISLTNESGNDILSRMRLSKEDLVS